MGRRDNSQIQVKQSRKLRRNDATASSILSCGHRQDVKCYWLFSFTMYLQKNHKMWSNFLKQLRYLNALEKCTDKCICTDGPKLNLIFAVASINRFSMNLTCRVITRKNVSSSKSSNRLFVVSDIFPSLFHLCGLGTWKFIHARKYVAVY